MRDIHVCELDARVGSIEVRRVVHFVGHTHVGSVLVEWVIEEAEQRWRSIEIGSPGQSSRVFWNDDVTDKAFSWRPLARRGAASGMTVPTWRLR